MHASDTWATFFTQLADVKKGITDEDILALATDEANQPAVVWDLADLQVCAPCWCAVQHRVREP